MEMESNIETEIVTPPPPPTNEIVIAKALNDDRLDRIEDMLKDIQAQLTPALEPEPTPEPEPEPENVDSVDEPGRRMFQELSIFLGCIMLFYYLDIFDTRTFFIIMTCLFLSNTL